MPNILDIIIPIYNTPEEYLVRALNSINKQKNINFKEICVIIIDDGSKEIKYKKSWFKQRFPKLQIKFIVNKENLGPGLSRQNGIDNSDAAYITFLDSDDEFYEYDNLSKIINYLKEHNDVEKLHTAFYEEILRDAKMVYVRYGKHDLECLHALYLKREFLIKNNIRFNNNFFYHEDVYFTCVVNGLVNEELSIYYDIDTYVWKYNPNSIVRSNRDFYFHFEDFVKAQLYSLKFLDNSKKNHDVSILANAFSLYVPLASNIFNDNNIELKKYGEKELYEYIKDRTIFKELSDEEINEYTQIILNGNLRTHSDMILKESFKDFINRLEKTYSNE